MGPLSLPKGYQNCGKWVVWCRDETFQQMYPYLGIILVIFSNDQQGMSNHRNETHTLPKANIAPENRPSQNETHLPTIHFQVIMLVLGRVGPLGSMKPSRSELLAWCHSFRPWTLQLVVWRSPFGTPKRPKTWVPKAPKYGFITTGWCWFQPTHLKKTYARQIVSCWCSM